MTTIPLAVLFHDGPIARAYLAFMRHAGLRPARVIHMISSVDLVTGKPVTPWLPASVRRRHAAWLHEKRANFWLRRIATAEPGLADPLKQAIGRAFDFPVALFDEIAAITDLVPYAGVTDEVLATGYADPALQRHLEALAPAVILYTGGGIVPASLLSVPGLRFVHVHPGFLPHVRGADGILWSSLVRGRPGASCFYMAPGIDTGDLIAAEEYPPFRFPVGNAGGPDDLTLYRAVFAFLDPVVRARHLVTVLGRGDPADLTAEPQDLTQGLTYHFMNPAVRRRALATLFPATGAGVAPSP